MERNVNWDYSSSFTVFSGQVEENTQENFIMSRGFSSSKTCVLLYKD